MLLKFLFRRCLWLVDEQEAQILSKIPADSIPGGRHKIGCILGAESANYKVGRANMKLQINARIKDQHHQKTQRQAILPKELLPACRARPIRSEYRQRRTASLDLQGLFRIEK